MPQLHEQDIAHTLGPDEQDIYEILLEEDELSASEKIAIMRKFTLNPRLLDATPDIAGSKAHLAGELLRKTFESKDKVVMFVNGYVEGITRGEDTVIDDLNLPHDIDVAIIDGAVDKAMRLELQRRLGQEGDKMLLVVSGQTADTGVDFSAAEAVVHYNEPWSVYDKRQQIARVYRPGLKGDLQALTLIAENTIEQGIHEYIEAKYVAVEKLLRGVPISEIEKTMLRQAERQANPNVEVSAELAKYYFSAWDTMAKIYGHIKEQGEQRFRHFLKDHGTTYAETYKQLAARRSYQANASRLASTLLAATVEERRQQPENISIVDLASGPEMLRRHITDKLADSVTSLDINEKHFEGARGKTITSSFAHTPLESGSVDYLNLSLGLHYTSYSPSNGDFERLEVLQEANRLLKLGGRVSISMMYSLTMPLNDDFNRLMNELGFMLVERQTGIVTSDNHFNIQLITVEKVRDLDMDTKAIAKQLSRPLLNSLKLKKTDTKLSDTRKIARTFMLGDTEITALLNEQDAQVLNEERHLTSDMENLRRQYGSIEGVPKQEILTRGYSRIFNGRRYVLFSRLSTDPGAVVIR